MTIPKFPNRTWRWMTDFWTIISFALIIGNFVERGALAHFLGPVLAIYVAVLAIFSADKEFERWHWHNTSRHRGEVYVIAWTALIVGILAAIYLTGTTYVLEPEIFSTYIVVLGILAITRKSKQVFSEHEESLHK